MKKTVLVALAVILSFGVSLMAQNDARKKSERKSGPAVERQHNMAERRAERMAKDLNLSDVEKTKVLELFKKQDSAMVKFRKESQRENREIRQEFRKKRQAHEAELKAIIGEEKYQKLQKLRQEQLEQREKSTN